MVKVRTAITAAGVALAFRIDRFGIEFITSTFDIYFSKRRKEGSVTGIASRHNAVEHINTTFDVLNQIFRRSNPHEIAWLISGHQWGSVFNRIVHEIVRFTDRETSDSKYVIIHRAEFFSRLSTEIKVRSPLDNGKNVLIRSCVAGRATRSSRIIIMSLFRLFWISITFSGVKKCLEPSM